MNKSQELEESHEVNVLQTTKRELQYLFYILFRRKFKEYISNICVIDDGEY